MMEKKIMLIIENWEVGRKEIRKFMDKNGWIVYKDGIGGWKKKKKWKISNLYEKEYKEGDRV